MHLQGLPLKSASVIVGVDPKGPVTIQLSAHQNQTLYLLGRPAQYLLVQKKSMLDGSVTVVEFNLANAIAVEYVPLTVVEPAPPVEGGESPAPVPQS